MFLCELARRGALFEPHDFFAGNVWPACNVDRLQPATFAETPCCNRTDSRLFSPCLERYNARSVVRIILCHEGKVSKATNRNTWRKVMRTALFMGKKIPPG
jgi:hypothetical protein